MTTLASKLAELAQVKLDIRNALEYKGQNTTNVPFTQFASLIEAIEVGSGQEIGHTGVVFADNPNYLPLDGRELDQTGYADLYAVIGDEYGEAATGNFKLPLLDQADVEGYQLRPSIKFQDGSDIGVLLQTTITNNKITCDGRVVEIINYPTLHQAMFEVTPSPIEVPFDGFSYSLSITPPSSNSSSFPITAGNQWWVICDGSRYVWVYGPSSRHRRDGGTGTKFATISPDGSVVVTCKIDNVVIYNRSTWAVIPNTASINNIGACYDAVFYPDGSKFILRDDDGRLHLVDAQTYEVEQSSTNQVGQSNYWEKYHFMSNEKFRIRDREVDMNNLLSWATVSNIPLYNSRYHLGYLNDGRAVTISSGPFMNSCVVRLFDTSFNQIAQYDFFNGDMQRGWRDVITHPFLPYAILFNEAPPSGQFARFAMMNVETGDLFWESTNHQTTMVITPNGFRLHIPRSANITDPVTGFTSSVFPVHRRLTDVQEGLFKLPNVVSDIPTKIQTI